MSLEKFELFDSHMHIIDQRFPLIENNGYLPDNFDCDQYLQRMADYRLCGGVVVSGSFQAFDQTYLAAALKQLGDTFVGVTQILVSTPDTEIERLDKLGVRAVRLNLKRGGSANLSELETLARRVHEIAGWHSELYVDSALLADLYLLLTALPAVSVDHLGLSKAGFDTLLKLAERGVRVKATGFSRTDFAIAPALTALYAANPNALMFGSDLPSTRAPRAYTDADFLLVAETLGEQAAVRVFSENARAFYRMR